MSTVEGAGGNSKPTLPTISPVAWYALISLFAVIVADIAITLVGPAKRQLQVADGFTVFAVLYIVAQAMERILEPFSTLILTQDPKQDPDITDKRMFVFWGIATVMGMVASAALGLYFLAMVLKDPGASGNPPPPVPVWLDVLTTGIVIGGGSKGVHDLLQNVLSPTPK